MDLEIACKIACVLVVALGFFLLTAQIRDAKQEVRITKAAVLDSIGLVRGDIVGSAPFRSRTTIPEPGRGKLQLLRVSPAIPDPAERRVVEVSRDSDAPSSEGVLVAVKVCDEINYDTESGRWLQSVLSVRSRSDSDTPAPPGQREPILPPGSSSGPRCSRR